MRLAALSCLQTLIKADSRALHPHWPVLLPVYSPLQTKYHAATLTDAIVRDPVPKVSLHVTVCTRIGTCNKARVTVIGSTPAASSWCQVKQDRVSPRCVQCKGLPTSSSSRHLLAPANWTMQMPVQVQYSKK